MTIFIHFTTKSNYEKIISDGFIKPKCDCKPHLAGPDNDKISAFKGLYPSDIKSIADLKKLLSDAKNTFRKSKIDECDMVAIVIEDEDENWDDCIGESEELRLGNSITKEKLAKFGEYAKTQKHIPICKIKKVI